MRLSYTVIASMICTLLMGQQSPTMDNYLFNPIAISPATAGQQVADFQTIYDAQWVGIKGAPRTAAAFYDHQTPTRFGFNLGMIQDKVGPMVTQSLGITTAYHLQLSDRVYLSTGIRYTLAQTSVDILDEFYVDKIDQAIYDIATPWLQNVDLSANLYGDDWFVGLAVKNVVKSEVYLNNYTARVWHVLGGKSFNLNEEYTLKTSMLLNVTENAPVDVNLHSYIEYSEKFGIGLNISPYDEIGLFYMIELPENMRLFYQYNYPLSDLIFITQQSHVLGFGVDLHAKSKSVISPKYFL